MKRLTFRTENQWRSVRDGGAVDLIRASVHANRWLWSGAITLAGFGVRVTFWQYAIGREHA